MTYEIVDKAYINDDPEVQERSRKIFLTMNELFKGATIEFAMNTLGSYMAFRFLNMADMNETEAKQINRTFYKGVERVIVGMVQHEKKMN